MGEAKNRARRAQSRLTEAEDDAIGEETAEKLVKQLGPILYAALMDEMTRRVKAGQQEIKQSHLPVGVETGVLIALMRMVWGLLPPNSTPAMLADNYRALIPGLVEIVAIGPAGGLIDTAWTDARAGAVH